MSARKVDLALDEIVDEIEWSTSVVAGKSFEEFQRDRSSRYIIERSIEIISEASRRIPLELKALRPEIDWRAIGAIGNVLRHEYHATSAKIVWHVVQDDFPQLRAAVEAIRSSLDP